MIRIRTKGSMWVIDEGAKRYCRFPLDEGGRERPEWGDERAGVLQDAVWHDYERWEIRTVRSTEGLLIYYGEDALWAPHPEVLT